MLEPGSGLKTLEQFPCLREQRLRFIWASLCGEPLAVVVKLDGTSEVVDGPVPQYPTGRGRFAGAEIKDEDAFVDKRIRAVAALVRGALQPVVDVRGAADQVIRTLRQAPPAGSHWANQSGCGPATVEGMKDDELIAYGCGMGHVPSKSSRFLYFFAKSPRQIEREWIAAQEQKQKARP